MEFRWTVPPTVIANELGERRQRVMNADQGGLGRRAAVMGGTMKAKAPWTDRTGNARQSLSAVGAVNGSQVQVTLFGGMSYNLWLEVRWGGRYAVIIPTMQAEAPALQRFVAKILLG